MNKKQLIKRLKFPEWEDFELKESKIDMYNPGCAPKSVEDLIEGEVTVPRNPLIAKIFRIAGWAETAGSGMMKIFSEWKKLPYETPIIKNSIESYSFKMIFPIVSPEQKKVFTEQSPNNHRTTTEQVAIKLKILEFCLTPQKLKEIMDNIGLKHRPNFINNYLNPLIKENLLALTIPDKPNNPKQMYVTTEKGGKIIKVDDTK